MTMRIAFVLGLSILSIGCVPIIMGAAASQNERMAALLEETKGADPSHAGVTGLVLDEQGTVVSTIFNGPAHMEGIKDGDRILAVDGLEFTATMRPLSGPPDSEIRLLVQHKDAQRLVTLKRIFWRSVLDGSWPPPGPPRERP